MNETIKNILSKWSDRLANQDSNIATDNPGYDHDYYFDHHLFGAALFIKELAHKENNMELLGIASKIELDLKERIHEGYKIIEEYDRDQLLYSEIEKNVIAECERHFFNEQKFEIDTSKYQSLIEANRKIIDENTLLRLEKYLDQEKAIRKIYNKVKKTIYIDFYSARIARPPSIQEIREEFERELLDFHKRAENIVSRHLKLNKS